MSDAKVQNVFITWSGQRSRAVAEVFKNWLVDIVLDARPFFSPDIPKGKPWMAEIEKNLATCKVGVVFLTSETLDNRWLNFEAGAIFKAVGADTYVCTFLIDGITPANIEGPLGSVQHTEPTEGEVLKLVRTIRDAVSPGTDDGALLRRFNKNWEDLKEVLDAKPANSPKPTERKDRELLEEILQIVRQRFVSDERTTLHLWDAFRRIGTAKRLRKDVPSEAWDLARGAIDSGHGSRAAFHNLMKDFPEDAEALLDRLILMEVPQPEQPLVYQRLAEYGDQPPP